MPRRPQHIRVLSDGRPGHETQSLGLAEAIARRTGAQIHCVRFGPADLIWSRYRKTVADRAPVDLLLGAGHRTHLALCLAAKRLAARAVVIMKPTWPAWFFDLCLVPRHDLRAGASLSPRFVPTFGALNRLPEQLPPKQPTGLVLIGGPSRAHGWDAGPLLAAIREVLATRVELTWTVSDSRRTPNGFVDELRAENLRAEFVSHRQTPPGWVAARLLAAEEAWVTADSVTMLFEAVTAGARTGILPMPVRRANAGPVRAVADLAKAGFATAYASWREQGRRLPPPKRLHETGRCADIVLERLFPTPGA